MSKKIRVLVVDDSALVRRLLLDMIDASDDMECVGAAIDATQARRLVDGLDPDVVTLDIEMPGLDGLDFLADLMRTHPTPVVMVSRFTAHGSEETLRALQLGAVDFVCKPSERVQETLPAVADELALKIRAAAAAGPRIRRRRIRTAGGDPKAAALNERTAQALRQVRFQAPERPRPVTPTPLGLHRRREVIFVGASTGGTEATPEFLAALPNDAPPVLVAQHMPAGFTVTYAKRLNDLCSLRVQEAADGEPLHAGHVYIAPGGRHLAVTRGADGMLVTQVYDGDKVNHHRPSVEVLFLSAAQHVGRDAIGVMLTGMGADGAHAMRAMCDAGSYNLAQDEASCVVFGMPRKAIELRAVHDVGPPVRLAEAIVARLRKKVVGA